MSNSQSNRPQQQNRVPPGEIEMNRNRREHHPSQEEHSGQNDLSNSRGPRWSADENDAEPGYNQSQRYDGQGDYGGSQGGDNRASGYRRNAPIRGQHEPSDFSFGGEYIQDYSEFRPSRMSRQSGSRSWIGVGESSHSGDQGGRSYTSAEYDENPAYQGETFDRGYGGPSGNASRGPRGPQGGFSGQRQSFAGRGPQGYRRSDERITEDVNEQLTQDHEVDATGIQVETKDGEVTLQGTVTDRQSKRRAEEIAEACSGVKDVQNQLRVRRDEPRDGPDDKRNKPAS